MTLSDLPTKAVQAPEPDALAEHRDQWRTAAQRVERAWQQWLACEPAECDWAHHFYADSLDREEEAALVLERDARALRDR